MIWELGVEANGIKCRFILHGLIECLMNTTIISIVFVSTARNECSTVHAPR